VTIRSSGLRVLPPEWDQQTSWSRENILDAKGTKLVMETCGGCLFSAGYDSF